MKYNPTLIICSLVGLFFVTALNIWAVDRDERMFQAVCAQEEVFCR